MTRLELLELALLKARGQWLTDEEAEIVYALMCCIKRKPQNG